MAGFKYLRVEQTERTSKHTLEQDPTSEWSISRWRLPLFRCWPLLFHLPLAAIYSIAVFYFISQYKPNDQACAKQLSSYSPALDDINDYEESFYIGTFDAPSIFRGQPNRELDLAWDNVTKIPNFFPLSENTLKKINKGAESVRFPKDQGGDYAGTLEVFHMLHCVDLLRRHTHFEYYKDTEPAFDAPDTVIRVHLDHCIEILRQSFMCQADTSIVTYNWVQGQVGPTPNVNTKHKCRNFDKVWAWQKDNGIPWGPNWRTGGEIELEHWP